MSIIYILIPIAILLTSLGIYLFFWAVKTEQFEDLEKQGMSILFDKDEEHIIDELDDSNSEIEYDKSNHSRTIK
jgi:cbb3-type cytochrome oxidase maturation protein